MAVSMSVNPICLNLWMLFTHQNSDVTHACAARLISTCDTKKETEREESKVHLMVSVFFMNIFESLVKVTGGTVL